ncbi:hypothetical protein B0J18DRAFT_441444 [Chaetomium sp. MPI-SDFR-AT-0129]|nr:hypothetical protein B0J18DRAFT_441444 [Chaetomium sp. MPI-SDFR-AT-0129]
MVQPTYFFPPRDYVKITKTYALAAADAFKDLTHTTKTKEPFHFVYVSGDGSTFRPGLFTPIFGRVKGETELALAEMQRQNPTTLKASTVRPSFVDWTGHEEIKPYLPEIGAAKNTFATLLSPVAKHAIKGRWSPTGPLGRFLTGMATNMWEGALDGEGVERLPGGFTVVDNPAMWRVLDQEAAGKK